MEYCVTEVTAELKFIAFSTGLTEGVWTGAVGSQDTMEAVALRTCPKVTVGTQKILIFMSKFLLLINK